MTHRFLVAPGQISDEGVVFRADQAHQIRHVLRLGAGDQVRIFDGVAPCDRVVELVEPSVGRIVGTAEQAPEPKTRLVVYPALLQRDKFETVLQKLTEIGAAAIVPVITARSLVREAPDERRLVRWRAIVRESTEQCGRGVVPELRPAAVLATALARAEGTVVMAYERERQRTLRDALRARPMKVSVFIGPEGGFADNEVDGAREAGAQVVGLGPRILRTETASPLLAALVLYELGDLS
jgi:16S rRNA (uracil1498-N3)-methyltransferase